MSPRKSSKNKVGFDFDLVGVVDELLSNIKERSADVLRKRYGMGVPRMTLQRIGDEYRITRERARQIHSHSLKKLRESRVYEELVDVRESLVDAIRRLGHIVSEIDLENSVDLPPDKLSYLRFLLDLVEGVNFRKEDVYYKSRWHIDTDVPDRVHKLVYDLYHNIDPDDLLSDRDIVNFVRNHPEIKDLENVDDDTIRRWLNISKNIASNPMGYWGHITSPSIRLRGLKDYAYMVMKHHGSPMHFREVADAISKVKGVDVHKATVHNELIKGEKFVLVGRGVYALAEWGYKPGIVKDVIADILRREGPLTRDEIVEKVLKERYLKEGTVIVNLHSNPEFKRDEFGRYYIDE